MGVSKNRGTPQIIHFNRVFHYKPSILGYPYFWKHSYQESDEVKLTIFVSSASLSHPLPKRRLAWVVWLQ